MMMKQMQLLYRACCVTGVAVALVSGSPELVRGQVLGPGPDPTAAELRDRALIGPRLQSIADASMQASMPDFANRLAGCGLNDALWSYINCGSANYQDSESALTNTTSDVTARFSLSSLSPWLGVTCITTIASPIGSSCTSGARAQTSYGSSKVYSEVRGGYSNTVPVDFGEPSEGVYEYDVQTEARASSEWVAEFTPNYTGWLNLPFAVERHGEGRSKDGGSAQLEVGVFTKPDNLLAPPLRPGDLFFDPQWTFYGSNFVEAGNNPNFWGWTSPYAERFDDFDFGSTSLTGGFYVESGRTYSLVSLFTAEASGNEFVDFWGTALFGGFEVPEGIDPNTAFSYNSAAFAVRVVGATDPDPDPDPVPVPEPATWALLTVALAVLVRPRAHVEP
jgi:hypothetical protein